MRYGMVVGLVLACAGAARADRPWQPFEVARRKAIREGKLLLLQFTADG